MKFRSLYQILGINRDATQNEIKCAFRKLARKYHPDVSKETDAEAHFKEINEAYIVLYDPKARAAYDREGRHWRADHDYHSNFGWNTGTKFRSGGTSERTGTYSDFFGPQFDQRMHRTRAQRPRTQSTPRQGQNRHAKVVIDLADTYNGARKTIHLSRSAMDSNGRFVTQEHTLDVTIPRGIRAGQRLRLIGQGDPGVGVAPPGDLYLEIEFRNDPRFRIDGSDVYVELPLAPWEAVLGAAVLVQTPVDRVELKVPSESYAGRKFRLGSRGIPSRPPGDLYVVISIVLPPANTEIRKETWRTLASVYNFNPREALDK